MNPKKQVFKDPIVRASMGEIRFPMICPICGEKGNNPARITVSPRKYRDLFPTLTSPGVRIRTGMPPLQKQSLLVHVCDEHYRSDEGDTNYKLTCFVCDVIFSAFLLFALLIAGSNLWIGRPLHPYFFLTVGAFLIAIVVTIVAFRSGPLNNAVKIIGFDTGYQNVWLKFKRTDYRDVVMEENPMHTELVEWVVHG